MDTEEDGPEVLPQWWWCLASFACMQGASRQVAEQGLRLGLTGYVMLCVKCRRSAKVTMSNRTVMSSECVECPDEGAEKRLVRPMSMGLRDYSYMWDESWVLSYYGILEDNKGYLMVSLLDEDQNPKFNYEQALDSGFRAIRCYKAKLTEGFCCARLKWTPTVTGLISGDRDCFSDGINGWDCF
ncbi:hypothetical protein L1987_46698 [Smallanthus sonchifolius]|uniref:Uncharacterized protein n=1 Tax=Smallanthus sonchifolius TaxID=185202 RepID=A0ACB9G138_9ASTR|nr:hypothetical protein L1987_46698 [Smallanthus sonchifolius]